MQKIHLYSQVIDNEETHHIYFFETRFTNLAEQGIWKCVVHPYYEGNFTEFSHFRKKNYSAKKNDFVLSFLSQTHA